MFNLESQGATNVRTTQQFDLQADQIFGAFASDGTQSNMVMPQNFVVSENPNNSSAE